MAIDSSIAMMINWPRIQTRRFDFATFSVKETPFNEAKEKAEEASNELLDWFDAARHYKAAVDGGSTRVHTDQKLAGLSQVLDGGMTVIIMANAKRDIEAAVAFAEKEGLRMVLAGGRDAWKVKELLAEKEIPVILGLPQSLPSDDDQSYDQPYSAPGELVAAGVKIAFASGAGGGFGPGGPHDVRGIPFQAAVGVPYGLPEEEALRAMTINPAEMLGLGDRLGTIEEGKIANLIVTDGNPLKFRTQILHLVIAGREVSTENKHLSLYERYRAR
jgi:imidazolonepropionase-like amidohydrolase